MSVHTTEMLNKIIAIAEKEGKEGLLQRINSEKKEERLDINATCSIERINYTALMIAVKNKNIKAMIALIEAGADIHFSERDNYYSLLHLAAEYNFVPGIHYLIDHCKFDVNANNDGWESSSTTPLRRAIYHNQTDAFDTLIERKADIHQVHPIDNSNLLHLAALYSGSAVIRKLIQLGCATNTKNSNNNTPIQTAIALRQMETLQAFIAENVHLNVPGEEEVIPTATDKLSSDMSMHISLGESESPVARAVHSGFQAGVNELIKNGATIPLFLVYNRFDKVEWPFAQHNLEILAKLLDKGLDVNRPCGQWGHNFSLLFHVAKFNFSSAIPLLIQRIIQTQTDTESKQPADNLNALPKNSIDEQIKNALQATTFLGSFEAYYALMAYRAILPFCEPENLSAVITNIIFKYKQATQDTAFTKDRKKLQELVEAEVAKALPDVLVTNAFPDTMPLKNRLPLLRKIVADFILNIHLAPRSIQDLVPKLQSIKSKLDIFLPSDIAAVVLDYAAFPELIPYVNTINNPFRIQNINHIIFLREQLRNNILRDAKLPRELLALTAVPVGESAASNGEADEADNAKEAATAEQWLAELATGASLTIPGKIQQNRPLLLPSTSNSNSTVPPLLELASTSISADSFTEAPVAVSSTTSQMASTPAATTGIETISEIPARAQRASTAQRASVAAQRASVTAITPALNAAQSQQPPLADLANLDSQSKSTVGNSVAKSIHTSNLFP